MKSVILNSLKTLTLTTALTGVIMASIAQAAIPAATVDDASSTKQNSVGQLYAAIKSDRDGTPGNDDNHSDDDRGHDNDDGDESDGEGNDDGDDNDSDGDDIDEGDDSDGDGDD